MEMLMNGNVHVTFHGSSWLVNGQFHGGNRNEWSMVNVGTRPVLVNEWCISANDDHE